MSTIVEKPWGRYEEFYRSEHCVVKRITVNPFGKTSLQSHSSRSEFWFCLSGDGLAVVGNSVRRLLPGNFLEVSVGVVHRIVNERGVPLVIAETQVGLCWEDDIVRLEDAYGRV